MSAVELLDVGTLIPDGIEPVEALRCWEFDNGKLSSLNGAQWVAGEALEAKCQSGYPDSYVWKIVRGGVSREDAALTAQSINTQRANLYSVSSWGMSGPFRFVAACPAPFTAELPSGYGYELETVTHDAPNENCTCGIYAATNADGVPGGTVFGKVKLWGKIVPGERGLRAQYAYPSEFEVPAELADHPALKAYGVPITVKEQDAVPSVGGLHQFITSNISNHATMIGQPPKRPRMHWGTKAAIAVNLAAAAFNLTLAAIR